MISFFKKKNLQEINLAKEFPWLNELQFQKNFLAEESIDTRLNEIKGIYKFLKSENGQKDKFPCFKFTRLKLSI